MTVGGGITLAILWTAFGVFLGTRLSGAHREAAAERERSLLKRIVDDSRALGDARIMRDFAWLKLHKAQVELNKLGGIIHKQRVRIKAMKQAIGPTKAEETER